MVEGVAHVAIGWTSGPDRDVVSAGDLGDAALVPVAGADDARTPGCGGHQRIKRVPVIDQRVDQHQPVRGRGSPPRDALLPTVLALFLGPFRMERLESPEALDDLASVARAHRTSVAQTATSDSKDQPCGTIYSRESEEGAVVCFERRYDARLLSSRRVIMITGCSSPQGIGFATARALALRGHAVHATVRDHAHDDDLRRDLNQRLVVHHLDLRDREGMRAVRDAVVSDDGRLDVLINNAGYGLIGGVEQVDLDRVRESFETNFFGTAALMQDVAPLMRGQRHGHIINVSTVFTAGLCPPALGYYIASKAALETVAQALAVELAPFNVRVTNFQPGPVMTSLSREWGERLDADRDPRPTLNDELYQWVLDGGGPTPQSAQEVADALCWLIDSESPPLALQSGSAARAYIAQALRDPTRDRELTALLAAFARD